MGTTLVRTSGTRSTRTLTHPPQGAPRAKRLKDPRLRLVPGSTVGSASSGREYRVGALLGAGGFGAAYAAHQVAGASRLEGSLVLKVSLDPQGWSREAYFGELLKHESGIVSVHESFAWVSADRGSVPLYCLVSELIEGGDVAGYLKQHPEPWPERIARREMVRLLCAVDLLHRSGAVHRDITPKNVFVTKNRALKLGDFGIALHRMGRKDVRADVFNPSFAPPAIRQGKAGLWRQADDVFHLGQLLALLLRGGPATRLTAEDARKLACDTTLKSVIQRCIGERRKCFPTAGEMLAALKVRSSSERSVVRSLAGKHVVFTGALTILRAEARRLVRRAGGSVERAVSRQTDVVVLGTKSPSWKAEAKGQKLLDVDRERERGHRIAVITERRFLTLVGR